MYSLIQALKFEGIQANASEIQAFMALQGLNPCAVVARRAAALLRAGV